MKILHRTALVLISTLALAACSAMEPLKTVEQVDLPRFMGDWYVIANIPTAIEKEAYNAVESYRLDSNGTVATTFTFRKGGFDGERKTYHPRGYVRDDSNALWGMQFVWPFKADYRIIYLDEDYSITVIGRNKRDYIWIMAREPAIPQARYEEVLDLAKSAGYDLGKIQKVPQRW